jgi:hypothetical protein
MAKEKQLPSIPGWTSKLEGNQLVLFSGEGPDTSDNNGIRIDVNKGERTLSISGWYDSCVGISGASISLDDITKLFKPTKMKGK